MSFGNQELNCNMDLLDFDDMFYEDCPTVFDQFPELWEPGLGHEDASPAAQDQAAVCSNSQNGERKFAQDLEAEFAQVLDELFGEDHERQYIGNDTQKTVYTCFPEPIQPVPCAPAQFPKCIQHPTGTPIVNDAGIVNTSNISSPSQPAASAAAGNPFWHPAPKTGPAPEPKSLLPSPSKRSTRRGAAESTLAVPAGKANTADVTGPSVPIARATTGNPVTSLRAPSPNAPTATLKIGSEPTAGATARRKPSLFLPRHLPSDTAVKAGAGVPQPVLVAQQRTQPQPSKRSSTQGPGPNPPVSDLELMRARKLPRKLQARRPKGQPPPLQILPGLSPLQARAKTLSRGYRRPRKPKRAGAPVAQQLTPEGQSLPASVHMGASPDQDAITASGPQIQFLQRTPQGHSLLPAGMQMERAAQAQELWMHGALQPQEATRQQFPAAPQDNLGRYH
ncbi:hypothetical protein BDZ91DRAFT_791264 [Kalaharituber pfeilii]|nr:hypothetical protein BDZ91DRAFT_791264 [Kalaharituber pfeilii]